MLVDARTIPQDTIIDTDVCIVGAGAAGITLALEFIDAPFRVCLLESGGLEFDEQIQSLNQGVSVGNRMSRLDESRLRFFGGTTNHWGGRCRPLDPDDFERRPWVPYSGWPLTRAELDPFYERAHNVLELGPYDYEYASWADTMPEFFRLPFIGDRLAVGIWQLSPPTRFGKVYRTRLNGAPNIETYLFANVVDIETEDTVDAVTGVRVACLEANEFSVRAKYFILAMGCIETARILLLSNKVQRAGLGNTYDLVGKYFMDHPLWKPAHIILPEASDIMQRPMSLLASGARSRLILSQRVVAEERIVKFMANIFPNDYSIPATEGYKSLKRLTQDIMKGDIPDNFLDDLGNVVGDIDGVFTRVYRRYFGESDLLKISVRMEQAPNPDSRITLTNERDALGLHQVRVDWRLTDLDEHSLRRALQILGEEIGRSAMGRLRLDDSVLGADSGVSPPLSSHHHSGATRMSATPRSGVVDPDCRVHGISNLYIASGAVFPTMGIANPTLTIVALALRLADRIKTLMA